MQTVLATRMDGITEEAIPVNEFLDAITNGSAYRQNSFLCNGKQYLADSVKFSGSTQIISVVKVLSVAQILAINTTPVDIAPAPGSAIKWLDPISVSASRAAGTGYVTGGNKLKIALGATLAASFSDALLTQGAPLISKAQLEQNDDVALNAALKATCDQNPVGGNFDVAIYIDYLIKSR